jgi:hypothetical protein
MPVAVYLYTATEPAFATGPLGRTPYVDWFVAVFTRVILIGKSTERPAARSKSCEGAPTADSD